MFGQAVLAADGGVSLKCLLEEQSRAGGTEGGSRSASAALRAGPCPNFEKLEHVSKMTQFRGEIRSCTGKDGLKEILAKLKPFKDTYSSLVMSCKMAVGDVNNARSSKRKQDGKAQAASESKKPRKPVEKPPTKQRSAATNSTMMLERELCTEMQSTTKLTDDFAGGWPVVITKQDWVLGLCSASKRVKDEVDDFVKQYSASTRRITDGRGQRQFLDVLGCSEVFKASAVMLESSNLRLVEPTDVDGLKEEPGTPALSKGVALRSFAMSAGSESTPVPEKAQLPTLRLSIKGTREVRAVYMPDVEQYLDEVLQVKTPPTEWLATAAGKDLEAFATTTNAVLACTIGPNDCLYIPPLYLVAHRVLPGDDHVGIALLAAPPAAMIKKMLKHVEGDHTELDGLRRLCDVVDEKEAAELLRKEREEAEAAKAQADNGSSQSNGAEAEQDKEPKSQPTKAPEDLEETPVPVPLAAEEGATS